MKARWEEPKLILKFWVKVPRYSLWQSFSKSIKNNHNIVYGQRNQNILHRNPDLSETVRVVQTSFRCHSNSQTSQSLESVLMLPWWRFGSEKFLFDAIVLLGEWKTQNCWDRKDSKVAENSFQDSSSKLKFCRVRLKEKGRHC